MISSKKERSFDTTLNQKIWLTRKEVCLYLSCSINFVDTRFPIKKYFIGKLVRYLKSDIDKYLMDHQKDVKIINNT
jgi:predicted DNA-binding transcriptional regulator AlpA